MIREKALQGQRKVRELNFESRKTDLSKKSQALEETFGLVMSTLFCFNVKQGGIVEILSVLT